MAKREYPRLGETIWTDVLPNGLRVVTLPRRSFKKTAAAYTVFCGGADCAGFPQGIAHFAEHRLFALPNGSDAMTLFSRRGAYANAFTAADMTSYHFTCTSLAYENLETLLTMVSAPTFTPEGVEKERPIILREIEMSLDEPDTALYDGLLQALYRESPIRYPILGTAESVSAITAETLAAYARIHYVPANAILTVAGPVERDRVLALAERLTPGGISLPPDHLYPRESLERPAQKRVSAVREVSATTFLTGIKTEPAIGGEAGIRRELLASLALNTLLGEASPLWSNLYDAGLINETFSWDFETAAGTSFLSFGGETDQAEAVIDRVFAEAKRLVREGIPADYFARRKKCAIGDWLRGADALDNMTYNLAVAGLYGYDYLDTLPTLLSLTREEVLDFLGRTFDPDRAATSLILPKEVQHG